MIHSIKILLRAIAGDPLMRFEVLRRFTRWWLPQYRFKWPQMAWWYDESFNEYLEKFSEVDSANTDRRWMHYQLMRLVAAIPGDTAECGVFRGAGSYLMCMVNAQNTMFKRKHFVFDSFEGLSNPTKADGEHWQTGDLAVTLERVSQTLAMFENVHLLKGWIPERFAEVQDHMFAFVHIDVDLFQPTLDSIRFFYPRMNAGAIILCDDYGFTSCPGATKAIDVFLLDKPEKMIALSGGGGFLIKGAITSGKMA